MLSVGGMMNKISLIIFLSLWLIAGQALHGTAADTAEALRLADAVREALANNPEIQRLKYRLGAVEAKAKQAPYLDDPEIAFRLGGVPLSNPTSFNRADANSIGIRQKLPFFGKLGLQEKIAAQEAKIAEEEVRAKEREIVAQVKMAYADLFMAERAIDISREQLEIIKAVTRASEARYQVGKGVQQDVLRALLAQTELMTQLVGAEQERKTAEVKLNIAMNRPLQTQVRMPEELPQSANQPALEDAEELALANRPEIKGAEQELERSERIYELAERNRKFPDFMIGWDYERMPMEMTKDRYSAMINIMIPFSPWTAGKRNYEVQEALAEIRSARANREAMKNTTLREVGELQAKAVAARRSMEIFREGILPQADLSFQASLAAYQTGRVEFMTLLDGQRALRDARLGYYKSRVALMQALADLERVVGKELQ
jgi:outer membrane protein TolC